MNEGFVVIEIAEDTIACSSSVNSNVTMDVEGLAIRFEVGDKIIHIENGFCDIYRDGEIIGGLTNYFTRLIE